MDLGDGGGRERSKQDEIAENHRRRWNGRNMNEGVGMRGKGGRRGRREGGRVGEMEEEEMGANKMKLQKR